MPYSHKIGPDDVLPALNHRTRCFSVPFIKSSLIEEHFKLDNDVCVDDDDGDDVGKRKIDDDDMIDTSLDASLSKISLTTEE